MVTTHDDARAALAHALPGARLRFDRPAKRALHDPAAWRRQGFWQAYLPGPGVELAGTYALPCDPAAVVRDARRRADEAIAARAARLDLLEACA